jgi:hypothetical protein
MNRKWTALGLTVALIASGAAAAEKDKDNDPLWVLMVGAAGEWPTHGNFQSGPAPSVEFNVIKDWLEVEVGAAKLFRGSDSEFETEVVFRKPFTLSETAEVMIGLGPIWSKGKGRKLEGRHHVRSRLHVLVLAREEIRMVPGTELFDRQPRKRAVVCHQCRPNNWFPLS